MNKATLPSDVTVGSRGTIAKAYAATNMATHHPVMSKSCSLFAAIGMSVNTHVRQMRPTAPDTASLEGMNAQAAIAAAITAYDTAHPVQYFARLIQGQTWRGYCGKSLQLGWDHAIESMAFGAKARSVCCGQDGFQRSNCLKKGWHQP
jgi:hypothetical protein